MTHADSGGDTLEADKKGRARLN